MKGNARGGPVELAKHLKRADTNERVEILGLRGVAALDLNGALREMYAMGAAPRTTRTLCHASINVPAHERLTPEQRSQAINRLAFAPGLAANMMPEPRRRRSLYPARILVRLSPRTTGRPNVKSCGAGASDRRCSNRSGRRSACRRRCANRRIARERRLSSVRTEAGRGRVSGRPGAVAIGCPVAR
jgi:hypothetical protein